MFFEIIILIVGFGILIKSADWLVDGASAFAKKLNVSDLAIGLTIVAFGTSTPELVVNIFASLENHSDIVLGNIIGSNNFNLFIILGTSALITPLIVQSSTVWKEIPFSLFAALLLLFLANNFFLSEKNYLSRIDGIILFLMFILFVYYVYTQLKSEPISQSISIDLYSNKKIALLIIVGLSGLTLGGRLVVSSSVEIARILNVSEKLIGLTIVAAGTSLPEFATSVVAAIKKNNDIAIGNIIGSNIFNIFFILSVSVLINPIKYNSKFNIDLYFLILGTALLFVTMFTGRKKRLDRLEAIVLILMYFLYGYFFMN
ncbi:MAG: calcium/sodium antiporter [Ignavibacterium sp.]|nr:calcium/sodium antiporter [Ignavibacterium sp.]